MSDIPANLGRGLGARVLGVGSRTDGKARTRVGGWRFALAATVSVAMAAGVAIGLARLVDADATVVIATALRDRLDLVALFATTYFAAFAIRTLAWQRILTTPQPYGALLSITHLALFANHVFPAKPGDVLRGYLLYRRGTPVAEATVTTVASRILDVAALLLLVAILAPFVVVGPGVTTLVLVGTGATVALIALVSLVHRLPPRVFDRLPAAMRRPVRAIVTAASDLPKGPSLAALVLLVVPSWILEAGVLWSVTEAAGLGVSIPAAVAITSFTILFQSVQITPGNLGVYEATMTGALVATGVDPGAAFAVAVVTHALKFAYSYVAGTAILAERGLRHAMGFMRSRSWVSASRFELMAARAWNVLNEGKPFTLVFSAGILVLADVLGGLRIEPGRVPIAIALTAPLALLLYRFDFPLRLRIVLWVFVALFLAWFAHARIDLVAIGLVAYFSFTVIVWGSVYYHLRIGTPLTNFLRFWKLVVENPDTTSANFLEQAPKVFLLTQTFVLAATPGTSAAGILGFTAVLAVVTLFAHRWFFTWRPMLPVRPRAATEQSDPVARRVLVIAIDGCRLDRLTEANTPVLDRLAREGLRCERMETVYPARTVTGFSSMLTGAIPAVHGMRSNFVPRLGVRCESVFDALRAHGKAGVLVGIAHLVDAFGSDVRSVSAVQDNDRIDTTLVQVAKEALITENPDLLVLQLLSVDQTGHARGSYREEYLERIEATDRLIGQFLSWAEREGFLDQTAVIVTSDHGQGRGVGGHGHLSSGEREVPLIMWGAGVPAGVVVNERRFLMDVTPTICRSLGVAVPATSTGRPIVPPASDRPLGIVIPALDEEGSLPGVLAAMPSGLGPLDVVVVDDGSTDATADIARVHGARVVRHDVRRGLGAALRSGLDAVVRNDPWAVVYLDADGEYAPEDIPVLLEPIRAGEADYVLGCRFGGGERAMSPSRRIANRAFTVLTSVMAGRRIGDGQTGMRAFTSEAAAAAEIVHDYNYAQVITLNLLGKGARMREIPISYRRRTDGSSFVRPEYLWRVPLGIAREMVRA